MSNKFPSVELIQKELKYERNKLRFRIIIKNAIYSLIVVAAIAALVATLVLPVLQVAGSSMTPTLTSGDIVILVKSKKLERGDLCGFSYSNKILIKRVIGVPGDVISIDKDGTVYVNGEILVEPYLTDKALGECDIEFPYIVPQESYFLMGDHRETSIDSRSSLIGSIPNDQIVGKIYIRVWPLSDFSFIK